MRVFHLKFGAEICEVVVDLHIMRWIAPHQTRSLWTKPCGAKTWSVLPYCHVRSVLILDMQCRVAIPCQHFGTTFWFHLQGSWNPTKFGFHDPWKTSV